MVSAINPTLSFTAHWNTSNRSLKNTLTDTVSKVALYLLHRLATKIILPSTIYFSKRNVQEAKIEFISRMNERGLKPSPIEVTTPDGVKLRGTFLQSPGCDTNAPLVIFCQPNLALSTTGAFDSMISYAQFEGKKCNFVLFDYRECGESEGTAIMAKDLVLDGESIYQFAKDGLKVNPENIHFMGYSFGGGVSARVKALHPECTGNYVNDRSFTGMIETVNELFHKGIIAKIACSLLKLLGWEALNSAKALENLKGKTLIAYEPDDDVIKGSAQLQQSPLVNTLHIPTMKLNNGSHSCPLIRYRQESGCSALEEIGNFLFDGIESTDMWTDKLARFEQDATSYIKEDVYYYVTTHFLQGDRAGISAEDAFLGRNGHADTITNAQRILALRAACYERVAF